MICPECHRQFDPDSHKARLADAYSKAVRALGVWTLNDRYWLQHAPGQVIEITESELTAVQKGATLEDVMEARRVEAANMQ